MADPPSTASPHGAVAYDLALFEALNDEYRSRPLVASPPRLDDRARARQARRRARKLAAGLDVAGKRVLEVGAGSGHLSRALVRDSGARSVDGVDIVAYPQWERLQGPSIRFHQVDLSREPLLPAGSIDAVVSNAALEHVRRPIAMIAEIARVLRRGGEALLTFNLHRGPKASHRYREVTFPWPHLLFDPEVCRAFYERRHGVATTFAWVNTLTAAEYMEAFFEVGLSVERVERRSTPIDISFYLRFEERLGRYPAFDLETDFLTVKLRRTRRTRRPPPLGYLQRQRALEEQIEARQPGAAAADRSRV